MHHGPSHRPQHAHGADSDRFTNYTLGGLVVYAAVIPVIVALLTAPALVGAFIFGIVSATVVSQLRGRSSPETTNDSDTPNHAGRTWGGHDTGP